MRLALTTLVSGFVLLLSGIAFSEAHATSIRPPEREVEISHCYGCAGDLMFISSQGVTVTYHVPAFRGNSGGYTYTMPGRGAGTRVGGP